MDFYIFEDFSDLENLPLLNIEWTLVSQFCFLDDLLKLCFLLDASIFTTLDEKKEEQKYLRRILLRKKIWEFINTVENLDNLNIQNIELIKIKLSQKLPLKQNYLLSKTCKKSHSITRTLMALNKFVFNCLVSLRIWVIESQL